MAVMAPELVEAGAGAAGAAVGGMRGHSGGEMGGFGDEGSPIAFMLAIVLIGAAMIALYFAFHNPSEWNLESGQYPGLVGRITQWMQNAAEQSGPLSPLTTSSPAASAVKSEQNLAGLIGGEQKIVNPASKAGLTQSVKNALQVTANGIIPGLGDVLSKIGL